MTIFVFITVNVSTLTHTVGLRVTHYMALVVLRRVVQGRPEMYCVYDHSGPAGSMPEPIFCPSPLVLGSVSSAVILNLPSLRKIKPSQP